LPGKGWNCFGVLSERVERRILISNVSAGMFPASSRLGLPDLEDARMARAMWIVVASANACHLLSHRSLLAEFQISKLKYGPEGNQRSLK
jgi:hypothetical protein